MPSNPSEILDRFHPTAAAAVACGTTVTLACKSNARRSRVLLSNTGTGDLFLWVNGAVSASVGIRLPNESLPLILRSEELAAFVAGEIWVVGSAAGSILSVIEGLVKT